MNYYRVINPTIPMLEELARLSFNVRWYTIEFRGRLGNENHDAMLRAERELDKFLKEHTEPITEKEKE